MEAMAMMLTWLMTNLTTCLAVETFVWLEGCSTVVCCAWRVKAQSGVESVEG